MRRLLFILAVVFLTGCGTIKQIPVETKTEIHYVDSLRVRDSVVIIPAEKEADIALPTDTLRLETSLAKAKAWVDTTTNTLKGILQNKTGITKEYVFKDRVEYRDSIQRVEIPVEVVKEKNKTPSGFWWLLGWFILSVIYITVKVYFKMRTSR